MPSPETIIADVALVTGVPAPAITGRRRTARVVWARTLAIAALRNSYDWWALSDLALQVHRTDHTTAKLALDRFRRLFDTNEEFRALAQQLQLA